jgi:hypothetical protein
LINAIQEQQKQIDRQKAVAERQQQEIDELKKLVRDKQN